MIYEIAGYFGAFLMGISLGLIGGGGSIFSVPILVYLFHINPVIATAYSLFVVGLSSAFGAFNHIRMGNIHWKAVFFFGKPSITSVFITRTLIIPLIPDPVINFNQLVIEKGHFFLILFAVFMLAAAFGMIRKIKPGPTEFTNKNFTITTLAGFLEGTLTGLVGAGGGFLIIPALVLLGKINMKKAIGSSLVIIAVKSLMGFMGDLHNDVKIDWKLLLTFVVCSILGILSGSTLSKQISGEKLKPFFGIFILIMALIILVKELFLELSI